MNEEIYLSRVPKNPVDVSGFIATANEEQEKSLSYLFESRLGGYHTYRIPAIIATTRGTLLAFAEGRKNSSSDTGDIDLLMKRSDDNGKTWSETLVIWDDAVNVCGNPAPVVVEPICQGTL